jgi:hypothetical protein
MTPKQSAALTLAALSRLAEEDLDDLDACLDEVVAWQARARVLRDRLERIFALMAEGQTQLAKILDAEEHREAAE